MEPILIGLYSPSPQSGKTTVSNYLEDKLRFRPVRFANPLKSMILMLFVNMGYSQAQARAMVDGHLKEAQLGRLDGKTPRELMQTLGTEWGRGMVHEDLWAKVAKSRIEWLMSHGKSVVVDDMRFPNELEAIEELGGYTVEINRPSADALNLSHSSEGQLDGQCVFNLKNDGSLEALHGQVETLVTIIRQAEEEMA